MLSDDQLKTIKAVFAARAQMLPLRVGNPRHQSPASSSQVFELQRLSAQSYYLLPVDPSSVHVPAVDGAFLYVILANDPGRIYCGVPSGAPGADRALTIEGHTSLSQRADVLYGGELLFERGRLLAWTNASGHYLPPASMRQTNLIPAVQRLLPDDRFQDFRNLAAEHRTRVLEGRGYAVVRKQ